MYGYGYYGYGLDPTVILLVIGMMLSLAASAKLKSTFAVYRKVRNHSGITGAEAAQRILRAAGITDVQVLRIFMEETLWQQLAWQHMSADMQSRMQLIMHL